MKQTMYTKSKPQKWTRDNIDKLKELKEKGFSNIEIAKALNRTEVSIQIKWKRTNKKNNSYNKNHVLEKYNANEDFLKHINPKTILDLYCGEKNFYSNLNFQLVTNDINKEIKSDYNKDALKLLCELYSKNKKFDLIDLDPFGSAFDCFDIAIKMAKKGIIITFGELGHKRFKRLDFIRYRYDIYSLKDFNLDNLINKVIKIGFSNKKELIPVFKYEWQNTGRVYFKINELKITEQWDRKEE